MPLFYVHFIIICKKKTIDIKKTWISLEMFKNIIIFAAELPLMQYCSWQYPCLSTHAEGVENAGWEGKGTTYIKGVYQTFVLDELKLCNFLIQSGT